MIDANAPGGDSRGVSFDRTDVREGFVASLALVPSVFVCGSVFGGLAVQAGLAPFEV